MPSLCRYILRFKGRLSMSNIQAVILGIIQGLAEFLPVSSSGHLILAQNIFGLQDHEQNKLFIVAVHLASAFAIMIYYRKAILRLLTTNTYEIGYLVAGSIPAALVGLLFKDEFDEILRRPIVVAIMLLVTGTFLYLANRFSRERKDLAQAGFMGAIDIGIAQAFAIIPGLSRSGLTIGSGFLIGINRKEAIRFSFFLAIPVILGAGILEFNDVIANKVAIDYTPIIIGIAVTFVVSTFAIKLLETLADKEFFGFFAYYLFVVGLVGVLYFI